MRLNKISLKEVDSILESDIEWIWWNESYDLSQTEFKFVCDLILAKDSTLRSSDIFIHWHAVVGEYCIYIKGVWSGYVEHWHFEGYESYEEYYAYDNIGFITDDGLCQVLR